MSRRDLSGELRRGAQKRHTRLGGSRRSLLTRLEGALHPAQGDAQCLLQRGVTAVYLDGHRGSRRRWLILGGSWRLKEAKERDAMKVVARAKK